MLAKSLNAEDRALFEAHPLFRALDEARRDELASLAVPSVHASHDILFEEGDEARDFFLVTSGNVRLYRQGRDGQEMTINVFGPGHAFAEAAVFLGRRYPVCAVTTGPVRLLRFSARRVRERMEGDVDLALGMLASLSAHLHGLVAEMTVLREPSTLARLCAHLLREAGRSDGEATFRLAYTKTALAERLGMTPETLSRQFAALAEDGVTTSGRTVKVDDLARLARHVQGRY